MSQAADPELIETVLRWLQDAGWEFAVGTVVLVAIFMVFLIIQGPLSKSRDGGEKPPSDGPGGAGSSSHE